ncbi:hypothetical protein OA005_02575, partial [Paracoccaceae bacterium]|nr:hypothetical protein [Paracoccaceae bacterium]
NILNAIRIIQPISSTLSSLKSITLPEAQKFYPSIIFIPEDKSATIRATEIQKNLSQKIQNIDSFMRRGTSQTISVQNLKNLSKGIKQISMSKYSNITAQSPSLNKLEKVSLPPKMDRTRATKIEMDLFNKSKRPKISKSIENGLILKKVFLKPENEKLKNFNYENVRVEEIFSDISLTKTLIKTADNKASSLPLVSLETEKPLIFLPSGTTTFKANISVFISPQKLLETNKNTFFVSALDEFIETNINIETTLGIKLSDFGIEIIEQERRLSFPTYSFKRWSGNSPTLKPKIIDTIKVLDDPTKSSGAVTFVELPPQMPQDVRKLKKISANSIKNLLVKNNPPSIPRRASIVGNSTLRNMIELNRTNLIGIFGKRKGRMALIRLSSGNTVKVSVGQEFGNGWRVIGIDLDKIHITNGNRQETLRIPG